jgi:hypothetical protein
MLGFPRIIVLCDAPKSDAADVETADSSRETTTLRNDNSWGF